MHAAATQRDLFFGGLVRHGARDGHGSTGRVKAHVQSADVDVKLTVFSYIGPFLAGRADMGGDRVSALLMLFGAAGVAGNALSGRVFDRLGPQRVVLVNLGLVIAGLALLSLPKGGLTVTAVGLALWGGGVFAVNASQQA
jgi:predicted MFS family arabinose efflux permease